LEDQKGVPTPGGQPSHDGAPGPKAGLPGTPVSETPSSGYVPPAGEGHSYEDPYSTVGPASTKVATASGETALATSTGSTRKPPSPPPPPDEEDSDDEGMLRMSFLEHLEELRTRIIRSLMGLGVAFVLCVIFANDLWRLVSEPATTALKHLGFDPQLAQITPMETFSTVWVKVPLLTSIFVGSPWILYQVWAFIAPGLYKRERRWAAPFVITSAGLFILGGVFAYFVAFRYGLEFLLGIGRDINIKPVVSVTEYFDLFVNVMLGIGLVFEMPILIFFLTLLRIASPKFLLSNSRYAILIIVIIAAVVTPTPDVFNLMLFAVPMCLLFFIGVFAGYLLTLHREHRSFPWKKVLSWIIPVLVIVAAMVALAVWKYQMRFIPHWPFLVR
jgi:sec-independent protein translocase protein TatC